VLGKIGVALFVNKILDISKGEIVEGVGSARFTVTFDCVVLRPEVGEVVDGIVEIAAQEVIRAKYGPLDVVLTLSHLPADYKYSPDAEGFVSQDGGVVIKKESRVRCRIFSVKYRIRNAEWTCSIVASMQGTGLGVL